MPASGASWIDVRFEGRPHAIGTAVFRGPHGAVLIDPGPSSSLGGLELGLRDLGLDFADVTDILLTHIHLDHAGGAGTLVRRHPRINVLVHERGAAHMADPARLVESATRLFGDAMMRSFGEMAAVPAGNLQSLKGGERITAAGADLEVAYTPGHASHHVSYFDRSSGHAFVGDTAGVCIDGGYVMPPTPPPDVDFELWHQSVARIERWEPDELFLTHFGRVGDVRQHLSLMHENLSALAELAREIITAPGTEETRTRTFADRVRNELYRNMDARVIAAYETLMPLDALWLGVARYWSKKGVVAG